MAENIMSLLNKLSFQIASQELENYPVNNSIGKNDKYFKKCVNWLRKKGCDVLLNKACIESPEDPCQTEYGGNWSPFVLLSDFERELKNKRVGKHSEILHSSLEAIQDREYDCINELLKFLLLLKKPFIEPSLQNQNEAAFSGSDFLLGMLDSFSHLTVNYTTDKLNTTGSNKKALYYEESWTKTFDGGFELLGEYSKKNLLGLEKGSLNSLFVCKSALNKIQSQSSAFAFTDFFPSRSQRQKSLLELCINTDDSVLLDKLVDNPITHKLPDMNFQSKYSIKSGFLERLSDECSKKRTCFQKKQSQSVNSTEFCSFMSDKSSAIELKRNSNCCHSFSILYEKFRNGQETNSLSDENLSLSAHKSLGGSKDIIIGLWEEQHELLKEFKPELENCFPKLRMISLLDYVEDVKYLFTGVNNGTFYVDPKDKTFKMVYGTCLQDVTPESLYHFSKTFLDIGNSYVKLIERVTVIGKNNFDVCKTVSQAFWKSVFDFLELHYALVLEIPSNINLMALKFSTMDMREMIMSVAEICKVSEPLAALPEGGQLLTYLLQVAEKLSKNCVRSLVFGIIRNCCTVYFMCILQTWMFQGSADCDSNEFFVNYKRPKSKTRTRCYYNSFYINNEKVPSFLEGLEENIFTCGKSIHFLKLFNKEDKFCQLLDKSDYPSMYPCFTEEDLEELKIDFEYYEKRVVRACGKSISIKTIREEKKEKERKYLEYVKECKRMEEERLALERRKAAERIKIKKLEQAMELNRCWREVKEEQKRKKEALKIEELKTQLEIQKRSKETEAKIKEEAFLLRNYYHEQLEALERRLNLAEERKEGLRHILTSFESDSAKLLNNNIQLDLENNITSFLVDIKPDELMQKKDKTKTNYKTKIKASNTKDAGRRIKMDVENNIIEMRTNSDAVEPKDIGGKPKTDTENNIIEMRTNSDAVEPKDIGGKPKTDTENNIIEVPTNSDAVDPKDIGEKPKTDTENNIIEVPTNSDAVEPKDLEGKAKTAVENNKMEDLHCESNQSPIIEEVCKGEKIAPSSTFYDVNSNPSLTRDQKVPTEIRKCMSNQSAAAEAKRNKFKVLRSEFDLPSRSETQNSCAVETRSRAAMTDLERNRAKVLGLEYSILKSSEFSNEPTDADLKRYSSPISVQDETFETINLDRKTECVNLSNLCNRETITIQSPSSGSLPSQVRSEDYIELEGTPAPSSMILNEMYQKALGRDAEIFQQRIAQENIFCSLKKEELTKPPCKDFMQFQRYLRKSVLIPLKIQQKLANDALLKQLLLSENLLSHLNSLRGYFFLNDGEFGRSFTHHTFRSLAKCTEPSQFFERSNLSNIVNEALNYTIHNDEPNAQNLSFQITKMPPFLNHASHDVLSPFELSYKANWPLNIILTEKALSKYKMVFRFLLKLKRINWTLNENYLHLNSYFKTKKLDGKWFRSSHYHKIQIYRHAMTQVMITLDDYIFSNGIQFPWICFEKDLETTENIDHLYQKHVRYMKDVFTRCFLSKDSEDLLECLHNLIEIALKFHYTTKSSNFELIDGKLSHPKYKVLKTTFTEFCAVVKNFLRILKEKISTNQVSKSHYVLIEKFDLKLT